MIHHFFENTRSASAPGDQRDAARRPRMLRPGNRSSLIPFRRPRVYELIRSDMRRAAQNIRADSPQLERAGGRRAEESLRPISACGRRRPGIRGRHAASRWSREGAGVSDDADLRSPPRSGEAETCPERGFRVDFRPRAPGCADHLRWSDCATRTPPRISRSRRASGRVPSRRARFRRAEPGGVSRHAGASRAHARRERCDQS